MSDVAEQVLHEARASRPDAAAPSTTNALVAAMDCSKDFDIQDRSQPETIISTTQLSNKFRTPYIVTSNIKVSTDRIMKLAKLFRDYGWFDIKADNET